MKETYMRDDWAAATASLVALGDTPREVMTSLERVMGGAAGWFSGGVTLALYLVDTCHLFRPAAPYEVCLAMRSRGLRDLPQACVDLVKRIDSSVGAEPAGRTISALKRYLDERGW